MEINCCLRMLPIAHVQHLTVAVRSENRNADQTTATSTTPLARLAGTFSSVAPDRQERFGDSLDDNRESKSGRLQQILFGTDQGGGLDLQEETAAAETYSRLGRPPPAEPGEFQGENAAGMRREMHRTCYPSVVWPPRRSINQLQLLLLPRPGQRRRAWSRAAHVRF
jgi:hypothetical protein